MSNNARRRAERALQKRLRAIQRDERARIQRERRRRDLAREWDRRRLELDRNCTIDVTRDQPRNG